MTIHLRPLPPAGIRTDMFGTIDEYAELRAGIDDLIEQRPSGGYGLGIYDGPWKTHMRSKKGYGKSPERHYKTIPFEVLEALPIWKLFAPDAVLCLWATSPHLDRQLELLRLAGFQYKSFAPWVKGSKNSVGEPGDDDHSLTMGTGYLWRNCSELMLIGTRGRPRLKPERRSERGVFLDNVREHSRKPDDQYRKAETLAIGPYIELFSRTDRTGWTTFGHQTGLFGDFEDEETSEEEAGDPAA